MSTRPYLRSALLAGAFGLSLLTAACAPISAPAAALPAESRNTIVVTGTGNAYGAPDVGSIQIGVQTRNTDPKAAVDENSRQAQAILTALQALGIDAQDLQTSNFSVSAQQDYDPVTGQPQGTFTYVVDNTLTVTVRDLAKLGDVLSGAVGAGANTIYGISFSVSDAAQLEAEARNKAMADARVRAEALAKAAGVTLGAPITISEYVNSPVPGPVFRAEAANLASVPVQTGQMQVSLQVNVTYEIK
ncbi:MAG: SIMPL domain-containing protein [Anaerolineales bacterium]|nr:SIMPL domain-containing protein [Anaerolineales bacterium]